MNKARRVSRNDPCPCGSGAKYKRCCLGTVDWEELLRSGACWQEHLSIRGRNLLFLDQLNAILETDSRVSLDEYKQAFTAANVRRINEALVDLWPRDLDITTKLRNSSADVSGLYIGDYGLKYLSRGIVRHSIYANKLLIVDPFIYPPSVKDEYNPIINPDQHRAQTLRNVNFWYAIAPWIYEGLVEVIHPPTDFDPKMNWDAMREQREKFASHPELGAALEATVNDMRDRHIDREWYFTHILSAPDSALVRIFETLPASPGLTLEGFLAHIRAKRSSEPDFLAPLGAAELGAQLFMITSGAGYNVARKTASITGSYLVTDLESKWREIELDRSNETPENAAWAPFAKALQASTIKYLDGIDLKHALMLRKEGRLESFRAFLQRVWRAARTEDPYNAVNAKLFAEELGAEIAKAEDEWQAIDRDLLKFAGVEFAAGVIAGAPLIAAGQGAFVAAAAAVAGTTTLLASGMARKRFPDRVPAAFFMKI